ncbi:MAG: hypothetical protein OEU26_36810, partial [Candidatus Tectomicrobia bacterium]|nr:hypothetical protein [Candidatus Tectomicrobia bacterium]
MEELVQKIEVRLRAGDKEGAYRLLREFADTHGPARAREAVWRLERKWNASVEEDATRGRCHLLWLFWLFGFHACDRCVWPNFAWLAGWFRRALVQRIANGSSVEPAEIIELEALKPTTGFCQRVLGCVRQKWNAGAETGPEESVSLHGDAKIGSREQSWLSWLFGFRTSRKFVQFHVAWRRDSFRRQDKWRKTIDDLFTQWDRKAAVENGPEGKRAAAGAAEKSSREEKPYLDIEAEAEPGATEGQDLDKTLASGQGSVSDEVDIEGAAGLGTDVGAETRSEAVADEGVGAGAKPETARPANMVD